MTRIKNELEILDEFRIKPSKEEEQAILTLKKEFKKNPIITSASYLFSGILSTLTGDGKKFLKDSYDNFSHIYKSSIRNYAISEVHHKIRKENKKLYDFDTKELEKRILKTEKKIKEEKEFSVLKKVLFLALGISFLPF